MEEKSMNKKIFSLSSCDWIGFDLDHTLIRYRLIELHRLIYELICEYLCEHHSYNRQLLTIRYNDSFAVKALIYDSLYGNLIQLDSNGFVHTALHGREIRLTKKQIEEIYPNAFEAIEEDSSRRFVCIFSYFEQSIAYLCATLVDLIDQEQICENETKSTSENKYSFFLEHFWAGFQYLFGDFNRGNYFPTIRDHPEQYIYQRLDVRHWLEKLRANGKKLFLGTNSRFDYTNVLCSYAFGDQWKDLFDMIIVDCKKPSFFARPDDENKRNFQRLTDENKLEPVTIDEIFEKFHENFIYSFGNSADLHLLMKRISGKEPIVIYFGDHIKSDINALKIRTDWLAAVIVEELEFDSPPMVIHTATHHSSSNSNFTKSSYQIGQRSKYFSSFFTTPKDSIIIDEENSEQINVNEQTEPDLELSSMSSYWYTYITKYAHFSVSCLSVLANHFDIDHQFENEPQIQHFTIINQNK